MFKKKKLHMHSNFGVKKAFRRPCKFPNQALDMAKSRSVHPRFKRSQQGSNPSKQCWTSRQASLILKRVFFWFFYCRGSRKTCCRLRLGVKCSALCLTVWSLPRLSSGGVHTLEQQTGCPCEYQGGAGRKWNSDRRGGGRGRER